MRLSFLLVLSGIIGAMAVGCGKRESASKFQDVGTDLSYDRSSYLYWLDGELVHQGRCRNFEAITRFNCSDSIKSMVYTDFRERLLTPAERNLAFAQRELTMWQREFAAIDSRLRSDPSNPNLQSEWRYVKGQLDVAQGKSVAAERTRNDTFEALQLLRDQGVVYRVTSDNRRYGNVRSIVANFYDVFYGTHLPPPALPDPEPTWVDPSTGKTWAIAGTQMTWNEASAACQRYFGWRMPSSEKDFSVGDGSNLDVANRLFSSHLGQAMPQLPYKPVSGGSDFKAKVVWTSDFRPSSSYGGLLNVFANIEGYGLGRYLHLLSSESRYTAVCVKD